VPSAHRVYAPRVRGYRRSRRWAAPGGNAEQSLEEAEKSLLEGLDLAFSRAAASAGPWLLCAPGCSDCCHGPFPITPLDVLRLRQGMDRARDATPARAARIVERARSACARLADGYPGNPLSGALEGTQAELDRFFQPHAGLACPVLDPATGRCELYAFRPVACRTYGPPLKFGDQTAPHCGLCFNGAPRDAVEASRIEPDREGLEQALLARSGVREGREWATLIAFAVAQDGGDGHDSAP